MWSGKGGHLASDLRKMYSTMHLVFLLVLCCCCCSHVSAKPHRLRHARHINGHNNSTTESVDTSSVSDTTPSSTSAVDSTTTTSITSSVLPVAEINPYYYDAADYPADETGKIESDWGAWNDDDEYPDEPVEPQLDNGQFFTDLQDYEEQGPSFQKLILLATARNQHRRSLNVPRGAQLTIAVI